MFKNIRLIKQEIKHSTWGIREYLVMFHFSCKNKNNEKDIVHISISISKDFNFYHCTILSSEINKMFNFHRMFGKKLSINDFAKEYGLYYSESYDNVFDKSLKRFYKKIQILERVGL